MLVVGQPAGGLRPTPPGGRPGAVPPVLRVLVGHVRSPSSDWRMYAASTGSTRGGNSLSPGDQGSQRPTVTAHPNGAWLRCRTTCSHQTISTVCSAPLPRQCDWLLVRYVAQPVRANRPRSSGGGEFVSHERQNHRLRDYTYIHDDAPGGSHGGTLDPATVTYGNNIDGSETCTSSPCRVRSRAAARSATGHPVAGPMHSWARACTSSWRTTTGRCWPGVARRSLTQLTT